MFGEATAHKVAVIFCAAVSQLKKNKLLEVEGTRVRQAELTSIRNCWYQQFVSIGNVDINNCE